MGFGTLAFHGVNAVKFTAAQGVSRYARHQILPVANDQALSDAGAGKAAPNYLMDELPRRVAKGAVKFRLAAQVAKERVRALARTPDTPRPQLG